MALSAFSFPIDYTRVNLYIYMCVCPWWFKLVLYIYLVFYTFTAFPLFILTREQQSTTTYLLLLT